MTFIITRFNCISNSASSIANNSISNLGNKADILANLSRKSFHHRSCERQMVDTSNAPEIQAPRPCESWTTPTTWQARYQSTTWPRGDRHLLMEWNGLATFAEPTASLVFTVPHHILFHLFYTFTTRLNESMSNRNLSKSDMKSQSLHFGALKSVIRISIIPGFMTWKSKPISCAWFCKKATAVV